MVSHKLAWGKFHRISNSGNICVRLDDGTVHAVKDDDLPADIRDTPEDSSDQFINPKYQDISVCVDLSVPTDLYELVDPPSYKSMPETVTGPFYLGDSNEIVEDRAALEGRGDDWTPPESKRKDPIEWDGTEQNIDSDGIEGRNEVFGDDRGSKNDLIDGSL